MNATSPVRALFVIEPVAGGAFRSTNELCRELTARDWEITIVHQDEGGERRRALHRRLTNLAFKLGRPRPLVLLIDHLGGRSRPSRASELDTRGAAVVENGAIRLLRDELPDLLVVSAVSRPAWTRLREAADERGVPVVFYVRGLTMLGHLDLTKPPDVVVVNSRALRNEVELAGYDAAVVYSVIDLAEYEVSTSRSSVLVVNPTRQYGGELAMAVAALAPDIPFELRESHSLPDDERAMLERDARELGNVTVLPATSDIVELYGRARVLLLPYSGREFAASRPRVVIEAQRSGIPALGSDVAGLAEAIGDAGVLVDPEDPAGWADALRRMFSDEDWYGKLSAAASARSRESSITPSDVADDFVAAVSPVFRRFSAARPRGLVSRSTHATRIARQRVRLRLGLRVGAEPRPIVVHQPGHVGSNSVVNALRSVPDGPLVLHPHSVARLDRQHPSAVPPRTAYEVDEQELERALRRRPDLPLDVITIVRDPVARNVTAFLFRHRRRDPDDGPDALAESLAAAFRAEWLDRREPFERFFYDDFLQAWDLDLDDFDRVPGSAAFLATRGGRRHLVIRTEDLDTSCAVIEQCLGIANVAIGHERRGQKIGYGRLRADFERALDLPEEYLDRMYTSPIIRRFYTEDEIAGMRRKWSTDT